MLNEGNQIHNFISSSGSGTVINYGSGSTSQKVKVPMVPVPVPQHCFFVWIYSKFLQKYSFFFNPTALDKWWRGRQSTLSTLFLLVGIRDHGFSFACDTCSSGGCSCWPLATCRTGNTWSCTCRSEASIMQQQSAAVPACQPERKGEKHVKTSSGKRISLLKNINKQAEFY